MGQKPTVEIKWEASLFEGDYNTGIPMIRLNNSVFGMMGTHAGTWIKITSISSKKTIYRIGRGSNKSIGGLEKDVAMIDCDGAFGLGVSSLKGTDGKRPVRDRSVENVDTGEESKAYKADWAICRAGFLDSVRANLEHPDRGYRTSMQVAFVGLAIGFLGLLIGAISLAVSIIGYMG